MARTDDESNLLIAEDNTVLKESGTSSRKGKCARLLGVVVVLCALALVTLGAANTISNKQQEPNGKTNGQNIWADPNAVVDEDGFSAFKQEEEDVDEQELQGAEYGLQIQSAQCKQLDRYSYEDKDSYEYKLASANCGWDYDYAKPPSKNENWKVVLFGRLWTRAVVKLSGCPVGNLKCPNAPKCLIVSSSDPSALATADVAVAFQSDAAVTVDQNPARRKNLHKVLYFREGHISYPHLDVQLRFDFMMGVNVYAELFNPPFIRRPSELLSSSIPPYPPIPLIPVEQKTKFAMSAISDCSAESLRDDYIQRMVKVLGNDRLHRYGKCGNRKLPPKPINNAAKLVAEYKFYLSFENIIQTGYVSEKLLSILSLPVVPVYYGAPNVPNITTVPSYINVADFPTPEALSKYLLYLDEHPEEYNKYHIWRDKSGKYFTEEYLDAVRFKLAGPDETMQYPWKTYGSYRHRAAQCCRLCDSRFVEWAEKQRKQKGAKHKVSVFNMPKSNIMKKFFGGE